MKTKDLREMVREASRKPFRVCLDDGRTYVVSHPDFAFVVDGALILGSGPRHDLGDATFVICYFEHISRIEQLKRKAKAA